MGTNGAIRPPADAWNELLVLTEELSSHYPVRRALNHRNPFDPRRPGAVLPVLQSAFDGAWDEEVSELVRPPSGIALDQWRALLPALVAALEEDRRAVASSRAICSVLHHHGSGEFKGVTVEHCRSGLRVYFGGSINEGLRMVSVHSKPYLEAEACAGQHPVLYDTSWGSWWARYTGLGIGQRIYNAALRALPYDADRRVAERTSSPEAKRLRRALHAEDPYLWQHKGCPVCSSTWAAASRLELEALHA